MDLNAEDERCLRYEKEKLIISTMLIGRKYFMCILRLYVQNERFNAVRKNKAIYHEY